MTERIQAGKTVVMIEDCRVVLDHREVIITSGCRAITSQEVEADCPANELVRLKVDNRAIGCKQAHVMIPRRAFKSAVH